MHEITEDTLIVNTEELQLPVSSIDEPYRSMLLRYEKLLGHTEELRKLLLEADEHWVLNGSRLHTNIQRALYDLNRFSK
jgi:predicted secreted protein